MALASINHQLLSQFKRRMPVGKRQASDIFFLAFALSALVFLLPIGVGLHVVGLQPSAWSAYIGLCLIALSIALWKYTPYPKIALLIYELTLLALVLFNAHLLGGISSPVMVWLGIVPLLPLFMASLRWAYTFLALSFVTVLAFYGLVPDAAGAPDLSRPTEQLLAAMMFGTFILTQMVLLSTVHGVASNRLRKIAKDNQRLRTLTEQLSLANEHKDKFLSSVSHEMRTPLNAIHGYLALLHQRQDLPEEASEHIAHASTSTTHLLGIVNDLLDYAQIRHGQFTLAMQAVALPALIDHVFGTLRLQAQQKGLDYLCTTSPDLPAWVHTDPQRLTQVMLNLLGNAIKFTAQGRVELQVGYTRNDQGSGTLLLSVSDTGPGIPVAVQQKIFTPFYQLANARQTPKGSALQGNGLGLSITQSLIDNWQGRIEVSSTVGQGSTFRVQLPMREALAHEHAPATASATPQATAEATAVRYPLRILVVDDHAMNRMVATATLRKAMPESTIDQAEDGRQALEKMAAQYYDVVLLDIVMPDISGIDVLKTVRSTYPAPLCGVTTLAFSANVEADVRQQCEQAGPDGFITKPFNAQTLVQTIAVMKK